MKFVLFDLENCGKCNNVGPVDIYKIFVTLNKMFLGRRSFDRVFIVIGGTVEAKKAICLHPVGILRLSDSNEGTRHRGGRSPITTHWHYPTNIAPGASTGQRPHGGQLPLSHCMCGIEVSCTVDLWRASGGLLPLSLLFYALTPPPSVPHDFPLEWF